MRRLLTVALIVVGTGAAGATAQLAQPPAHQHTGNCCVLEGFPPSARPVLGVPGAMTHPDLPDGYVLIHGDIQVKLDDYRAWLAGADGTFGDVTFWPPTIAYSFDSNVNATNQQRAIDAMSEISARAGLTFIPWSGSQPNRLFFRASDGNNSPIGMQVMFNTINIVSWANQMVIVHEIYHSLGFWHEHTRPDRDTFVTINWGNIESGREHNFEMVTSASIYGPYDFDSVMHYPRDGFGINGADTITVNQPWNAQWQNAIGQRDHFSTFDEITVRGIYRVGLDRWWSPGAGGSGFGNLINPLPHATFAAAYNASPAGAELFIKDAGAYSGVGTYSKAMTIRAPMGATIGN